MMFVRLVRVAVVVVPFLLAGAKLARAGGPPTLAVNALAAGSELAAKGFAFEVRASQCGSACLAPVLARVEGLVDGRRVTRAGLVVPVNGHDGRWLVKKDWPASGSWTLVLSLDSHGRATALVDLSGSEPDVRIVQRAVSADEIDALVRGAKLSS